MSALPAFETKSKRKSTNEAPEATKRKLTLVVELLTQRRVRFSAYRQQFGLGFRSFQRDLQQIDKIGESSGFRLTGVKDGEFVELVALDGRTKRLSGDSKRLERMLVTMAQALGEPILRELGSRAADTPNATTSSLSPRRSSSKGRRSRTFAPPCAKRVRRRRAELPFVFAFRIRAKRP